MILHVVHLDVHSLEVGAASDDALVVDAAVQRVTMWLIVRVCAIVATIVVVGSAFMQAIDGRILGAIRDEDHNVVIHALSLALGEEEPVGKSEAAVVFLEVELRARSQCLISSINQTLEAGDIRNCDRRFRAFAFDFILSRSHYVRKNLY